MMKGIVLCADDYGQAPEINQGIIDLLTQKRLSAVSCMVNTHHWNDDAHQLFSFKNKIDIGLHFNLTHGEPLSKEFAEGYGYKFPGLARYFLKNIRKNLNKKILKSEFMAQLTAFKKEFHSFPDFIDGHQHIHQFPIIREAVLEVCEDLKRNKLFYIRLAQEVRDSTEPRLLKRWVINKIAEGFEQLLQVHSIPYNQHFSGIYKFNTDYISYFRRRLSQVEDRCLVMCHPGLAAQETKDPLRYSRLKEYNFLRSNEFLSFCEFTNINLIRFFDNY